MEDPNIIEGEAADDVSSVAFLVLSLELRPAPVEIRKRRLQRLVSHEPFARIATDGIDHVAHSAPLPAKVQLEHWFVVRDAIPKIVGD